MKKFLSFLFFSFPLIVFSKDDTVVDKINNSVNGAISELVYDYVAP
jgi:hypothetical protein